ncbi:MAG: hypothetical protein ACO1OD_08125 [Croceibacterium sp.]
MDTPPQMPPMPDRPIAEALVECGVRPGGFTITYDDVLQGNVIAFAADSGASTANIECIWRATWSEFPEFADDKVQAAYHAVGQAYYETHFRGQFIESARARLAERNLLETLPALHDSQNRESFAVALEKHCGFESQSILRVSGDTFTVWPQTERAPPSEAEFEKLSCLLAAMTLASEADGNFKIGLVGNEKFRESEGE